MGAVTQGQILENITVCPETGCWLWDEDRLNNRGYGSLGGGRMAHRLAYELWIGPIPMEGHRTSRIDHNCQSAYQPGDLTYRRCCNPMHLTARTHSMNTRLATIRPRGQMKRKDLRVARYLHDQIDFS